MQSTFIGNYRLLKALPFHKAHSAVCKLTGSHTHQHTYTYVATDVQYAVSASSCSTPSDPGQIWV